MTASWLISPLTSWELRAGYTDRLKYSSELEGSKQSFIFIMSKCHQHWDIEKDMPEQSGKARSPIISILFDLQVNSYL